MRREGDAVGLSHYRFRSVWDLDTPPGDVYAVLERAGEYPEWWPQVREVVWRGDGGGGGERAAGSARIRSLLPYDLRITARLTLRDPAARALAIEMDGDLEGWARWRLAPRGGPHGPATGTRAVFEQEVEARRPLLRLLALPGRPLFEANHALMMRAGHHGLRRRLGEVPPGGRGKEFG
ncbi:SRPBCC family protein [Streptomyces sp. enrichment culture]|uniref:SRPBCC family protein n=1 Tax=Streptomyces sp. enrichment culture TaxID=1795815 RepID=UPI003F5537DE